MTIERGLRLAELRERLQGVAGDCRIVGDDLAVTRIAIDSREVGPGDLFAALPGAHLDGRDYVPRALAAGAAALLLPAGEAPPSGVPALLCEHPRRAAALVAHHLVGEPGQALGLLGVTGTNGKSSCVHLLQALMSGDDAWGLLGTLRVEAGGRTLDASHTTPDPVSLAGHLASARDTGLAGLAMEVSSHALDQERVIALRFSGVLFTNLSRDHLDYHGDMRSYLVAKARLLGLRRPGAPALVNVDDPAFRPLMKEEGVLGYGRRKDAHYRIEEEAQDAGGSRFRLRWPAGSAEFATALPGPFNVMNCAGALALALEMGESPGALAPRLATFAGVPGRMESIALPQGPAAIVDFAHSPDAVGRVLAACRPLGRGRIVVVVGAGGDRDRGKRPLMAKAAQEGADLVVLTSDNPRGENPADILADMESGMDEAAGSWHKEVDRAAAIEFALAQCGPEDMVVLLGKGHETTQEIAGVFHPFDDAEVLRGAWARRNESE